MTTHENFGKKRVVELFGSYLVKMQRTANQSCSGPLKSGDQIAETLVRLMNINDENCFVRISYLQSEESEHGLIALFEINSSELDKNESFEKPPICCNLFSKPSHHLQAVR